MRRHPSARHSRHEPLPSPSEAGPDGPGRADGEPLDLFESERPRLAGLAYRLLGSMADAEDVVQETWIRWSAADHGAIERPGVWLTTVTTRLALDRLRSAERTRAEYVGPWLPEPVAIEPTPEAAAELAESLTFGFLVLLDRLSGVERAVLLLADVFRVPFAEVAETVGRSEVACRQIASRARRRIRRDDVELASADGDLLVRLLDALGRGDADALVRLLHPEVVLVSDGGADRHAGRRPVLGIDRVGRVLLNLARRLPDDVEVDLRSVNLRPALVMTAGTDTWVVQVDEADGRAHTIRVVVNPDKVHHLQDPVHLT